MDCAWAGVTLVAFGCFGEKIRMSLKNFKKTVHVSLRLPWAEILNHATGASHKLPAACTSFKSCKQLEIFESRCPSDTCLVMSWCFV